MRAFISHRLGGGEDLCTRLERVENDLTVARKVVAEGAKALKLAEWERETFWVEADKLKKESEATKAKLKGFKQENSQLKREVEELRAGLAAQKKEIEELQTRFVTKKKELEVGFVA